VRIGAYEAESQIGRGGMGAVFRARSTDGRTVAVKLLLRLDETSLIRFERERRLLASLGEAEGFVPLIDWGDSEDGPFLVMPLLTGGTLRDRLRKGPLAVAETIQLGQDLARALGRAHERGIVHRDMKPENVIFTAKGRPLVADLGLAKHWNPMAIGASQSRLISAEGCFRGTIGYGAPEVMRDASKAAPSADVFALGATLYECLAGKPAFDAETVAELIAKVAGGRHVPVAVACPEAPPWLAEAIERSLARELRDRFTDGIAFSRALGGPAKPVRQGKRTLFAASGIALLAVAPIALWSRETPRPLPPSAHEVAPRPPEPPAPPRSPPPPPARSASELMSDAQVAEIDSKIDAAIGAHDVEVLVPECDQLKAAFPKDGRAVFASALSHFWGDPTELDARRELTRAAFMEPGLTEAELVQTVFLERVLGFDVVAAGIAARALPRARSFGYRTALHCGAALLNAGPPFVDDGRAETLLAAIPSGKNVFVDALRAEVLLLQGKESEALAAVSRLAAIARHDFPSLAANLEDRLTLYEQRTSPRVEARRTFMIFDPVDSTKFVEQLEVPENAWGGSRYGTFAIHSLDRLAEEDLNAGRKERAALSLLAAARYCRAYSSADTHALRELRNAWSCAADSHVDVRSLVARELAIELAANGDGEALSAAREAVRAPPSGEQETRSQDELAAGWWVVATAANVRGGTGDLNESLEAIEKGLACDPFDRRSFEALRALVKKRLAKRCEK
jgi:serine/threonine-protein kinase